MRRTKNCDEPPVGDLNDVVRLSRATMLQAYQDEHCVLPVSVRASVTCVIAIKLQPLGTIKSLFNQLWVISETAIVNAAFTHEF
jgi:hypothetical protein